MAYNAIPLSKAAKIHLCKNEIVKSTVQNTESSGLGIFRGSAFGIRLDAGSFAEDELLELGHLLPSNSSNRNETGDNLKGRNLKQRILRIPRNDPYLECEKSQLHNIDSSFQRQRHDALM